MAASSSSPSAYHIAVIGDAFVDIVANGVPSLPSWGKDVAAAGLSIHSGGSAGNTAVNLARLGVSTRYFTMVGNDSLGDYFINAMKHAGVIDTEHTITRVNNEPTACCVVLSSLPTATSSSDRCFVNSFGSNRAVTADHFLQQWDVISTRRSSSSSSSSSVASSSSASDSNKTNNGHSSNDVTNHIHIAGYFNCSQLQTISLVHLCERARASSITISLDTQTDSLTDRWRGHNDNLLHLLPLVDYFMPSDVEAMAIANKTSSIEHAALWMVPQMRIGSVLIIKCGANGARAYAGGTLINGVPQLLHHQPSLKVQVVDTTGAGDAFNAAFVTARGRAYDLKQSMMYACGAGGYRVSVISGSDNALTWPLLHQWLLDHPVWNPIIDVPSIAPLDVPTQRRSKL